MPDTEEGSATAQPDELKIVFKKMISLGKLEFHEMTVREPTAGQFKEFSRLSGAEATIMAVALSTGIPVAVVNQLPISQLMEAERFITGFFGGSPTTGGDG